MNGGRITRDELMMTFAYAVAERSTCSRLRVGAVVTNWDQTKVYGYGYNGNARGLPNECDDPATPGGCGCIHAEVNALIKIQDPDPTKVLFVTDSPCATCAKLIINAGIVRVVYGRKYRNTEGLHLLVRAGVAVEHLHRGLHISIVY